MPTPAMRIAGEGERPITKRVSLTKTLIDNTHCPAGQNVVVVYDNAVRALCIRVTRNAKSFYVYRKSNGRPLRFKIGSFPDMSVEIARKLAFKHLGQIVQGIDPREERRAIRQSITLQELFDRWDKNHAASRHTAKTRSGDKSRFDTCLADWKARPLASIREHHVRDKHEKLATERGHTTANRAVQLLRRLLNFARISPNPAASDAIKLFKETSRERFLQADELPRFFAALDKELNQTLRDFFYMALWTGARRSNVASMRWDELDIASSTWTIPPAKTKNKKPLVIHLVDEAKKILVHRRHEADRKFADGDTRYGEWVFPSKKVDAKTPHLTEPKGAWKRILADAKIKDLRLHDLRRTLGSWQAVMGASLPVIGKSLGHLSPSTTAIYARLNIDPVRASVNLAASAIQKAAAGKSAKAKPAKARKAKSKRRSKNRRA